MFIKIYKIESFYQLKKNGSLSDMQTVNISGFIESLSTPVKSNFHR